MYSKVGKYFVSVCVDVWKFFEFLNVFILQILSNVHTVKVSGVDKSQTQWQFSNKVSKNILLLFALPVHDIISCVSVF